MQYNGCDLKLKKVVKYQTGSISLYFIKTGFSEGTWYIIVTRENMLNLVGSFFPVSIFSIVMEVGFLHSE